MKHLLNKKWWEAYINWKLSALLGYPKWMYGWWIGRCKMLKNELNKDKSAPELKEQ